MIGISARSAFNRAAMRWIGCTHSPVEQRLRHGARPAVEDLHDLDAGLDLGQQMLGDRALQERQQSIEIRRRTRAQPLAWRKSRVDLPSTI